MQIPLDQFEQYIDETILKRGLSYFQRGYVHESEEISPGVFEATVTGSENYTVQLVIRKHNITDYACDCPYDAGPVCKHIAAVIFYLQQETLEIRQKNDAATKSKNKKKPVPAKRKTTTHQVKELLDKIPHETLKEFISEKSADNASFRNIFLSTFAWLDKTDSKEFYARQVKAVLKSATGRHGFIEWNATRQVWKAIRDLLSVAQKHIEHKNYQSAFFACSAVMEEMMEALQNADDSNGDIGGCIDSAYEMLHAMASSGLPGEIRKELFGYALFAVEKKIFSGWDWHTGMLTLASRLFATKEEAQEIIEQLDKARESEYEKEEAQKIKLSILRKIKGEKEAEKFIEQNLANPSLRREAISKAIKNKDYQKAITLAQDGAKRDAEEKPGLAMEWYDWLLKIAQLQKDREKTVEYARLLFTDHFRHEQDYYQIMKKNIAPRHWQPFVEDLIKDIETKSRWVNVEQIANIYICEQWWSRLMQLVAQNPSLHYIELYEKELAKVHASELVELYEQAITNHLKSGMGRNHYQTTCRYLRRMRKLGAGEKVNMLIEQFRKQYPQRRALLEELNTV